MASSSDVVKKVMRFKLQLSHSTDSATVLKILQKLKDLEITLDVLAETGIGKTVNSLRKHKHAGEFAKALVRGWKRLVPKESTSHTDDRDASESFSVKDELDDQNCPNNGSLVTEDLNNNCVTSHDKGQNSSYEAVHKTESREADSEKHYEKQKRYEDHDENQEKDQQENQNSSQNSVMKKKLTTQKDEMDNSVVSKEKRNDQRKKKSGDDDTLLRNKKSDSTETSKSNSDGGRFVPEKESNKLKSLEDGKESLSFEFGDKRSNTFKLANVKDDRSSETAGCSDKKRKKIGKEKHGTLKEYEHQDLPGHKNPQNKRKHNDEEKDNGPDEPCMSFESYLNYDLNVFKRKDRPAVKKPPQKIKTAVKEEATKDLDVKAFKPSAVSVNVSSPKQRFKETVMDLLNLPLPACLPVCEKPSSVEFFERKVEESDFCDISEEAAVFTGQRLNRKMQVYSGAKTVFLPTMMSLHQQCIRTLQNNIDLLYETGGVPFEILEPVLERCTPEQLLRIEECNPIYMGVTDHLWGKHCQREFKDSRLLEYESWKEMYIRLSEERERKLQRLTKSIVSAHSNKPKGRQVKMAFIHTVAKPPRDVRIQQEIHGTAVPQPHQLRCSVKVQDNRARPSWSVVSRSSSSSSSGAGSAQDPRKKPRVAPMMVKSLKAFKKQLGRR